MIPALEYLRLMLLSPVLADVQLSDGTDSDAGDDSGDEPGNQRLLNAN